MKIEWAVAETENKNCRSRSSSRGGLRRIMMKTGFCGLGHPRWAVSRHRRPPSLPPTHTEREIRIFILSDRRRVWKQTSYIPRRDLGHGVFWNELCSGPRLLYSATIIIVRVFLLDLLCFYLSSSSPSFSPSHCDLRIHHFLNFLLILYSFLSPSLNKSCLYYHIFFLLYS
jgi:hypothetical protein